MPGVFLFFFLLIPGLRLDQVLDLAAENLCQLEQLVNGTGHPETIGVMFSVIVSFLMR